MNAARRQRVSTDAQQYRIRVAGHLDQHWAAWFGGFVLIRHDDGTTTLTGIVADQAELHGLLTKVRDLGVTLLAVDVVARSGSAAPDRHTIVEW